MIPQAEEAVRGVLNIPYGADVAGQYRARASMQEDTGRRVIDAAEGVQNFAESFSSALGVAAAATSETRSSDHPRSRAVHEILGTSMR